ncbi:MAG: hypothetical protein KUG81_06620 [Gammaproteobacteria bacterium]|nr:hypothetical protein [Gammaproteobacteria bacterium]
MATISNQVKKLLEGILEQCIECKKTSFIEELKKYGGICERCADKILE